MIIIYSTVPQFEGDERREVYGELMYRHETYPYRVVGEGEENGYDDSDFFAIVPDDKGGFMHAWVGSTRCWSYGNRAVIDAPPSLIREYLTWKEKEELREYALRCNREEARFVDDCSALISMVSDVDKLRELYAYSDMWSKVLKALSRAKRSAFRLSLRDQVIAWIDSNSTYEFPLSDHQYGSLAQYL